MSSSIEDVPMIGDEDDVSVSSSIEDVPMIGNEDVPVVSITDVPIHIMIGHGQERTIQFHHRKKMDEGRVLVTFTDHGKPVEFGENICLLNRIFANKDNKDVIDNIFKKSNKAKTKQLFKKEGLKINMYYPGDRYPELLFKMPYSWTRNEENKKRFDITVGKVNAANGAKHLACKSGVFDFPIPSLNPEKIPAGTAVHFGCRNTCVALKELTFEQGVSVYKEITRGTKYPLEPDVSKSVTEIMDELGEGIYVYPVCRTFNIDETLLTDESKKFIRKHVDIVREKSTRQQIASGNSYKKKSKKTKKSKKSKKSKKTRKSRK